MIHFLKDLKRFFKNLSGDKRIPRRDKLFLIILIGLIISPIDFIPDWIPVFGQLDDLMMVALFFDYFFSVLDFNVLLSHYPWGLKSITRVRLFAKLFQFIVPNQLRKKIWKYRGELF